MNIEKFTGIWDKEIKPLAQKCADGQGLIFSYEKETDYTKKQEIRLEMKKLNKKDWLAVYYIGAMIFDVEHDLCNKKNPIFSISLILKVFKSDKYYKDVFDNNECDESMDYKKLAELLDKAEKYL